MYTNVRCCDTIWTVHDKNNNNNNGSDGGGNKPNIIAENIRLGATAPRSRIITV